MTDHTEKLHAAYFRERLNGCADAVFTETIVGGAVKCTVIFIDGLISSQAVNDYVLKPLAQDEAFSYVTDGGDALELIADGRIYHGQRKLCGKDAALAEIMAGGAVAVFDGAEQAAAFDCKGYEKRSITEPTSENVLKGSKDAFVESLRVNTATMRQRIQTSDLKITQMKIGRRTNTTVALMYIDGIVNPEVVEELKNRLSRADIDGLNTSGRLEAILTDPRRSILPQILYTERPDRLIGNILEGRVGIFADGVPLAYIAPVDLNSLMQASEDYALHHVISSVLRVIRYVCAFASLVLPAFYVSVTSFHQEMLPTKLALAIIASKRGVPFPTFVEVLLMLIAFEVLIEAGLRLPRTVGQAVSIVGALVVGQAAIAANILSPGVVIIIAAAGITGFVVPNQDLSGAVRLCRIVLVLLSTVGGLFGTTAGLILMLYNMCTLDAYGTPYLSPFAGAKRKHMFKDTILRASWRSDTTRAENILPRNPARQKQSPEGDSE